MSLGDQDLDCNACNEYQQEDRGCVKASPTPGRWKIGDDEYNRCPLKLVTQESNWWIRTYNFMEKGILPRAGGWMDQSNKFVSAMSLIAKEVNHGKK